MNISKNYFWRSRRWVRNCVALTGGLVLAFSAVGASAADVSFTEDTAIPLATQGISLTVLTGSEATTLTVNADNIVVVVPTGSHFIIQNTDRRALTNDQSVPISCQTTLSQLYITGPLTVTVTPATSGTCTVTTTGTSGTGGGGGGGSGSAPPSAWPTTPASTTPTTPVVTQPSGSELETIANEANGVDGGSAEGLAGAVGTSRNQALEASNVGLVNRVVPAGTSSDVRGEIANFITYGTSSTLDLGAGERAGVVNSFTAAFGHLPQSEADWSDALKIANGRWPSLTNASREASMGVVFKKIYLRDPNRSNAHDDAAIVIMTYGLRIGTRNLGSEKAAINSFKAIYGHNPTSASDWDAVRAVAYSGATR